MEEDQDEKNQSESFTKQQMRRGKDKLKDEGKKQAKQKLLKLILSNPKVALALVAVLLLVVLIVVFIGGAAYVLNVHEEKSTSGAKAQAVEISYSGEGEVTGTNEDLDKEVNKVIIKPNSNKSSYEIAYNDNEDNLSIIGNKIEQETQISSNKFTDFELGVLGALMDNGADLEYYTEEELHCFPAFIKAEACTQFLDLRSNIDANNYKPAELKDLKENEVPGVVLIQRTNIQNNNSTTLTYAPEEEFDKKLEGNSESEKDWLMKHFTVNEKGDLKIATWTMNETTVDNPQNYPENLPDEEKEKSTGKVYYFDKIEIPYSDYIKKYTMPFEFLVQLLVYTKDTDFCMELVEDYIIKSKIVINIQEEETDTHITEVRDYTVYSKDEKRIDYKISPIADIEAGNNLLLKNGNPNLDDKGKDCTNYYDPNITTVNITRDSIETSYSWEVIEADTWLIHMIKTYLQPEEKLIKDDTENIENIPEDYTMIDEQNSTDTTENAKDNNVKMFKDEREEHYKDLITIPKVNLDLGAKEIWDYTMNQFVKIPGDNRISITPEDKIQSPWTSKEYNENENLPSTINITTKENGDLPQITYPFSLNNNKYTTEWTKDKIAECLVTKLNIKKFERIDLKEKITTKITKWEADQNPVTEIHIYATKDGQPGRGQVNGDNYEKFLIAYDNNEDARDEIDSISYWLFEAMESNEKTVELVDYIKWILYLYDGNNYGVIEAPDTSIFESDEFITATGGGSALWNNDITKDEFINTVKNYIVPSGSGKYGTYKWGYERYFIPNAENFYDIATSYGLDPRFIFCIGIHESGFGTSAIANEKGNFFGWNANDSNPYGDASSFYDMSSGIETVCKGLANQYISSNGSWYQWIIDKGYNPTTIQGIGCRYASDPNWANAVIKHMRNIFNYEPGFVANGSFLAVAKECHDYIRQNNYSYIQGTTIPADENSVSGIDCSAYVTWVLYEYGYTELKGHQKTCSWFMNTSTMQKMGWTVLPATQAEAGDIVVNSHHMEIYAGDGKFYNAGSTEAIRREISNCGVGYLNDFTYAIRVTPPGGI